MAYSLTYMVLSTLIVKGVFIMEEIKNFDDIKKVFMNHFGLKKGDYPFKAADAHVRIVKILVKNNFTLFECKDILDNVLHDLMKRCRLTEQEEKR